MYYRLVVIFIFILCGYGFRIIAMPDDATPPLQVNGRYLQDPCGNQVLLHGVAMTPSPWFNGCAQGDCRWENYDVQGCLDYNTAVMDKFTNAEEGWHLNYVRLHIDPYWSNTPGQATEGENDISAFDFDRFVSSVDNVIVPLIQHAQSRGMYVILRPPGVCPHEIAVGDAYHDYLKTVWRHLADHPDLRNADNVMFELANEPVHIKGTNGEYGSNTQSHFDALKLFFQPIVDMVREKGANNVLWIPGSGYQSHYKGFANNPIEGDNIAYAVHIYPGYWGQDNNDPTIFRDNWNENIKPVADFAPIAITEIDWAPEEYPVWGKGGVTGTAGEWGFGANFKALADESGNVSWNLLSPENLIDSGYVDRGIAYNEDPEACALPVYNWFQEYAAEEPDRCDRYHDAVYEIELGADASQVVELANGQDANGAALVPAQRNNSNSQRWRAQIDEEGYWSFVSMSSESDRVIVLQGAETSVGTALVLGEGGGDHALWELTDLGDGLVQFRTKAAALSDGTESWGVEDCNLDGSRALQVQEFVDGACQTFRLNLKETFYPYIPTDYSDEIYEIEFRSNALKVLSVKQENGTYKVYPESRKAADNQRWRVISTDEYWQFIPLSSYSGRPLALEGGSIEAGSHMTLGEDADAPTSYWKVVDLGNGYHQIISKAAIEEYRGVDVENCDMSGDSPVQLTEYSGELCQQFRLHYIKDYDPEEYVLDAEQGMNSLNIYPNPITSGTELLITSEVGIASVTVLNMNGQEVYIRTDMSTRKWKDVLNLKAGVYILKLATSEGMQTQKLIVR
ncbi:cellulase family glycosylhydrolase [Reichenbachiella sp. MSK19-1]|uniref:cellulase family glycosylhydrolase n=1 Tax=Reichenbachiella sp. MSK19-1 TaxID=1897631 RepID=UPI001314A34A|nr:cellulase family glycosylhydrolase [Reichenbachiella sp. MSK19-1]